MVRHLILTGGRGYIGARLAAMALAEGRLVTMLVRGPGSVPPGVRGVAWALGDALPAGAVDPAIPVTEQALVHLAHDWTNQTGSGAGEGASNIEGTKILLESSRAAGVGRFVFVSSQSAREDAANIYGRVKWRVEQLLRDGEVAARVGLVYGGPQKAMYGLLATLTRVAPVLPMIDPWRPVQPIHLDEVCRGLLLLADGRQGGWMGLASADGVPFGAVLKTFAAELHGKRLPIAPVPLRLALLGCAISAAIPVGPTVDRERVLGLAGTRKMACGEHLAALGLTVVPLAEGLRGEPASRRAVLAEARAALGFVLRASPGRALIRRYVRAVGRAGPVGLPRIAHAWPGALRFVEPLRRTTPLGQRLALATALAEASPEGERALSQAGIVRLGLDLGVDALALPVRALASLIRR